MKLVQQSDRSAARWLSSYYFIRAGVSTIWVVAALTLGKSMPAATAALLVGYPAWDAAANLVDARRNGGLGANFTQAVNAVVST